MKKIYLVLLPLVLIFIACGKPTSALNYFEKDEIVAKAIQYTKKRDLVKNNEVQAMVFISYLNNIKEKFDNEEKESFLIGVHLPNPDEKHSMFNNYKFRLNGNKATQIETLGKNPEIIKIIPLKNKWAVYYIVSFETQEDENELNIDFIHSKFGVAKLKFEK